MTKTLISCAAGAALICGALWTLGVAEEKNASQKKVVKEESSVFMRAKLASSHKVLEGLVTEDFDLVRQGAEEMKKISEAGEWRKYDDPVYDHYSAEFRRLCEKLIKLAEDENIEGASFTYLYSTNVCISCHQYVRDVVRITADSKETPHSARPAFEFQPIPTPPKFRR
ncbi:MAG: hypothetical protein N2C14_06055 [Planctomycetales bacterium]